MRFRLIPRDEAFYPLFSEAAENVAECARRLRVLLEEFPDGREPIDDKVARVTDCERQGDEITRKILRRLNSSSITPFDREDIHALTEELDDVVDEMQAAADLLVLHNVENHPVLRFGEGDPGLDHPHHHGRDRGRGHVRDRVGVLMDRRAVFFVVAAVACAALAPATDDEIQWIPIAMSVGYALFAVLSLLDFLSRHREHDD